MRNKKIVSEQEKLKLYEFFEKELTTKESSVNLIYCCQLLAVSKIKHLIQVMTLEKNLFSEDTLTIILEGEKILFAMESCDEIRRIFAQYNICLGPFFQVPTHILKIFYKKYPEYNKPPVS